MYVLVATEGLTEKVIFRQKPEKVRDQPCGSQGSTLQAEERASAKARRQDCG